MGGVHNDLIKAFEAGYTAGVKAVDPSIKVDVKYIQESDLSGFDDPAGGKTAATGQFDKGADVVYHASVPRAPVSSTPRSRPATASGRSGWTPTSTSPRRRPRSRTSSPRRSSASTWRRTNGQDGRRRQAAGTGYITYDLKNDGVGYATSGGFLDEHQQPRSRPTPTRSRAVEIKVPTTP